MSDERVVEQELIRYLADQGGDVYWVSSLPLDHIFYVSRGFEAIWGRTCDELYAAPKTWLEAIHPADRLRADELIGALYATGELSDEFRVVRPDGSIRWIRSRMFPVRASGGSIHRLAGIARDITYLKEHERALREREERFHSAFTCSAIGAGMVSPDGCWAEVNPMLCLLLGYPEPMLRSTPVQFVVHPEDRPRLTEQMQALSIGDHQSFHLDLRCIHRQGHTLWVTIDAATFREPSSGRSMVIQLQDVTERRQIEDALRIANAELARSVAELERQERDNTLLGDLGEWLRSCQSIEEAYTVLCRCGPELLPGLTGAIYLLEPNRTLVSIAGSWNDPGMLEPSFAPSECWAMRRGRPHLIDGSGSSMVCHHLAGAEVSNSMCVPLMGQGEAFGIMHVRTPGLGLGSDAGAQDALSSETQRIVTTISENAAAVFSALRFQESLAQRATRDPLTGAFNRRHMEETFDREMSRARRSGGIVGIAFIDIDHFKKFNDLHGHAAGDALLRDFTAFLQGRVRLEDTVCRYGGEEFVVIFAGGVFDALVERVERMRDEFKRHHVLYRGRSLDGTTFSAGIASFPRNGTTLESVFKRADAALYEAKGRGRDRIVVAAPLDTGANLTIFPE